jgi:macrolide-specific efflux system membrane fusion protein
MRNPVGFVLRRPFVSKVGAVLLAVALIVWRTLFHQNAPQYLTAQVVRGDIEQAVLATGTIRPSQQVSVGAQVSGQLRSLNVKLGDRVHRGQLLAEIDPVLQENELRRAKASFDDARAQRAAKMALLRQHELEEERQAYLLHRDAGSRADYDVAKANAAMTRANIASLNAQIVVAKVAVDTARANLGYTRITAPIDGEVIAVVTQEGQTVVSAQAAPVILILANLDEMTVRVRISEADVIRIRPGQPVRFSILGAPGNHHESWLRAIEPAPESFAAEGAQQPFPSQTQPTNAAVYYNGLFDVPNPTGLLRTSMTAQVFIVLGQANNTLLVPMAALGKPLGRNRHEVHVLATGKPQARHITVGLTNDVNAQVLDGLSENDQVIVGHAGIAGTDGDVAVQGP